MRTSLLVLVTTLSLASSSKTHRVSLNRVESSDNTREHIDRTLARYSTNNSNKVTQDTSNRPLSRIYVQRQEQEASSRRSKWIDASRVPLEYNPSQVAFVSGAGIGTPPQYFNLEFDIGSTDTWVTTEKANCTTSGTKCSEDSHRFFHPSKSTTFAKEPNVPWKIETISKAKIQGVLHTDVVQVAGFVVEKQVLGAASVLDNVGVWLGSGDQGGELIFGGRDHARFAGDVSYFDVPDGSVYWSTPVHSLTVVIQEPDMDQGGKTGKINVKTHVVPSRVGFGTGLSMPNVIFDTSSNVILVPPRVAQTVHQKIHNFMFGWYSGYSVFAGAYTVSCNLKTDPAFDIWVELGATVTKADTTPTQGGTSAYTESLNNSTTAPMAPPRKDMPRTGETLPPSPTPMPTPLLEEPEPSSTNRRFRISGKDLVRERVPFFGSIFNTCYSGIQPSKTDDDDWVFGNI
ncbi:MAG: aspartic peptidase domain-containing protein [Podila humilis]|nr:MAG: aspartic peptidase domain-containing protein [Podila humilis]